MKEIKNKNIKWWIGIMSCVTLFAIIGVFSYEKMSFIWNGVKIQATIEQKSDSPLAIIRGKAPNANYISLNGREIFIDKQGNFTEVISMLPGYSVVTLEATDKFGKSAEKKFEIVREKDASAIALLNN